MDANDAARIERYRRFGRPDWRRFVRPNWERYVHPAHHEAKRKEFALRDRAFETAGERHLREEQEERERQEQERLEAKHQREIEAEALKIKADLAWLRFELFMVDMALRAKANFNPQQPRVPKGNPDGGQWTDASHGANSAGSDPDSERTSSVHVADGDKSPRGIGDNSRHFEDAPTPKEPPANLPEERPARREERTSAIKEVARWLVKNGARAGTLGAIFTVASWLREYEYDVIASADPPRSLEELQHAVSSPKPGYQKHHIVEQGSAEQDGYSREEIDSPDNLVLIPTLKHREITTWYQTKNDAYGGLRPRDYLRGKSWEERRRVGLHALREVWVLK